MRARWMDPVTGRFLSEDPARDGANWFAYCGGDPVNAVDRTGTSGDRSLGAAWWLMGSAMSATAMGFAFLCEYRAAVAAAGVAVVLFTMAMVECPTSRAFQYGTIVFMIIMGGQPAVFNGLVAMVGAAGAGSRSALALPVTAAVFTYSLALLGAIVAQELEDTK